MGKVGAQALEHNPNWKGGRTVASNGYVLVKDPDNPSSDVRGYVYEHRQVAQKKIGRPLCEGEEVHHVDHDRTNNSPDNLVVMASHLSHGEQHRRKVTGRRHAGEDNDMVYCECGCNASFLRFDGGGRPRRFVSGHNTTAADVARLHR